MLLAFGIVCGVVEAARSGRGQVVDAAMVDGAALLAGMMHGLRADGQWGERGTNLLDSGAWFYEVYETADGRYVSLGAIDDRSRAELLRAHRTGRRRRRRGPGPRPGDDRASWPAMKARVAARDADEDARRVGRAARGHRRLLRAGARPRRGARAPPPAGAGDVHRGGRRRAARARRRGSAGRPAAVSAPPPGARASTPSEALAAWGFAADEIAATARADGRRSASAGTRSAVVSKHSCTSGSGCSSPTSTAVSPTPRSTSSSSASALAPSRRASTRSGCRSTTSPTTS